MSETNLRLPPFLIADLYKSHLVEIDDSFSSVAEDIEIEAYTSPGIGNTTIKLLGENKRNIAIMLKEPEASIIREEELQLLVKILKACLLNISDIAIINLHDQNITFEELNSRLKLEYVLFFDVEPATVKLPFSIPHFQLQQFAGCRFLTAPSLKELLIETPESKLLKRQLWVTLQKTFQLA